MAKYSVNDATLKAVADAIRAKEGSADLIPASAFAERIAAIETGVQLPELTNPGSAGDLLEGKQLIDQYGNVLTGTMPVITSVKPTLEVDSAGIISSSIPRMTGYVDSATTVVARKLPTQEAKTITPGTADQTIAAGTYLTGTQTIKGDANLLAANIKSGVSIFGVAGSLVSGMQSYQITETYADSSGPFTFTCGFEPKAALIFNNNVRSTTSDSAETYQDLVVFIYPELSIYLTVYLKVSTQIVYCQMVTQTTFEKSYTWSFTSTGMTLLKSEGDVLDGAYTILLFA